MPSETASFGGLLCLYLLLRHAFLGSNFPQSSAVCGQFSFHSWYSSRVISPLRICCFLSIHSGHEIIEQVVVKANGNALMRPREASVLSVVSTMMLHG